MTIRKTTCSKTVLWADDDPDDRLVIGDIIGSFAEDYHLIEAEDGCAVLRYLDALQDPADLPCLVVLDINMPKLSGIDVMTRLKADERFRDLPLAVFTTSCSRVDRSLCEQYSVPMCTKPLLYSDFEEVVIELLQLCRSRYFAEAGEPEPLQPLQ